MIKLLKSTNYFKLYEVTKNVYAAIKTNPIAMSNAGFINLGNIVVIFDAFLSTDAANELKKTALEITGNNKVIVVNSHFHLDHCLGNCVFNEETKIFSSDRTYLMITDRMKSMKFGQEFHSEKIQELEDKLKELEDEDEILDVKNSLVLYQNYSNSKCKIVPPNVTFSDKLSIKSSIDSLDLKVIKKAHSLEDVIGISLKNKVAFAGDLLFIDEHPHLGGGNPLQLKKQLQLLLDSDINYFIPGHGTVCEKGKVLEQMEYIDSIISLVKNNIDEPHKLRAYDLPKKFHDYKGPSFKWSVKFLAEYLKTRP